MRYLLLFFALATSFAFSESEDDVWYEIGSGGNFAVSLKRGSFELSKSDTGEKIGRLLGKVFDTEHQHISYYYWSTTNNDCIRGVGMLSIQKIDGSPGFTKPFVLQGLHKEEDVPSGIAAVICNTIKLKSNK